MFNKVLLLAVLLTGCGIKHPDEVPTSQLTALEIRVNTYVDLLSTAEDHNRFSMPTNCDTVLFNGLTSAGLLNGINLTAAESNSGEWLRRPVEYGNCYPIESGSTISKDMFVGILWHIWRHQDLPAAERLWDYGTRHSWNMGSGEITRTQQSPNFVILLAQLIYKLGGDNHLERQGREIEFKGPTGFEAHLQVATLLLKSELFNGLSDYDIGVLKWQADRQPTNPLFYAAKAKYTDGDMSNLSTLISTSMYPVDRLPTSADVCEPWPIQRDAGDPGLSPCNDGIIHTGGDLIFILSAITGNMK